MCDVLQAQKRSLRALMARTLAAGGQVCRVQVMSPPPPLPFPRRGACSPQQTYSFGQAGCLICGPLQQLNSAHFHEWGQRAMPHPPTGWLESVGCSLGQCSSASTISSRDLPEFCLSKVFETMSATWHFHEQRSRPQASHAHTNVSHIVCSYRLAL